MAKGIVCVRVVSWVASSVLIISLAQNSCI